MKKTVHSNRKRTTKPRLMEYVTTEKAGELTRFALNKRPDDRMLGAIEKYMKGWRSIKCYCNSEKKQETATKKKRTVATSGGVDGDGESCVCGYVYGDLNDPNVAEEYTCVSKKLYPF